MTNGCIVLTSFHFQSQAKFSPERAKTCITWIEEVTGSKLGDMKDQIDFAEHLKDGSVLCSLINCLQPGSVKKINTLKAPFKQVISVQLYSKTVFIAHFSPTLFTHFFREKTSRCT